MSPKDPAPAGAAPLRSAIAEAYEHASALSDYFGRLMADSRSRTETVPEAAALAEAEALTAALAAIIRDLPRLAMRPGERAPEAIDKAAQG
jgi:ribosomal protein L16 Arg81 hydroxylase